MRQKKVTINDLPENGEWVLAAEAAEIANVSRQYLHNVLGEFKSACRLSGYIAFRRSEVEEWAQKRNERMGLRA